MTFYKGCEYNVLLWGGDGGIGIYGNDVNHGGTGAYISANITLNETQKVYVMVGGAGENGASGMSRPPRGGWNGGGNAGKNSGENPGEITKNYQAGAGGGSTDIRLLNQHSQDTLKSRLLVAGGGSGSAGGYSGAPGGPIGYHYSKSSSDYINTTVSKTLEGGTHKLFQGGDGGLNSHNSGGGGGGGEYGGKGGNGSWFSDITNVGFSGSSSILDQSSEYCSRAKVTLIECLTYKNVPTKDTASDGIAVITFDNSDVCHGFEHGSTRMHFVKPKRNKIFSAALITVIRS